MAHQKAKPAVVMKRTKVKERPKKKPKQGCLEEFWKFFECFHSLVRRK